MEQAAAGNAIALEDLGYDIAELEATFGPYLLSLGEYDGKHYGLPTNVNMKSLGLVPRTRVHRSRLHGADHVGRADRTERPDRRRRLDAVVHRHRF